MSEIDFVVLMFEWSPSEQRDPATLRFLCFWTFACAVEVAAYSSGPIGRFVAQDVLSIVRFYKSRAKK
jgi:hypothetical protein